VVCLFTRNTGCSRCRPRDIETKPHGAAADRAGCRGDPTAKFDDRRTLSIRVVVVSQPSKHKKSEQCGGCGGVDRESRIGLDKNQQQLLEDMWYVDCRKKELPPHPTTYTTLLHYLIVHSSRGIRQLPNSAIRTQRRSLIARRHGIEDIIGERSAHKRLIEKQKSQAGDEVDGTNQFMRTEHSSTDA